MSTSTTPTSPEASFHIAFCVDHHYFRSMGATIASIIAHNPSQHFTFHIFAFAISDAQRQRLAIMERHPHIRVCPHVVDPTRFSEFSDMLASSYYSLSTFTRLVIPSMLKELTNRVLYLDADILCIGSIDELVAMDNHDTIACVISDVGWTTKTGKDGRYRTLKLNNPQYFNAGVIDINIPLWEHHNISEAAIHTLLHTEQQLDFNDQDALNIVLDGRARYIPVKWNYIYGMITDLKRGKLHMVPVGDAVFIHFAGAIKPWNDWSGHAARNLFARYHAMSAWHDLPLDQEPMNYKEMRICSRLRLRQGRLISSVAWHCRYLIRSIEKRVKKSH